MRDWIHVLSTAITCASFAAIGCGPDASAPSSQPPEPALVEVARGSLAIEFNTGLRPARPNESGPFVMTLVNVDVPDGRYGGVAEMEGGEDLGLQLNVRALTVDFASKAGRPLRPAPGPDGRSCVDALAGPPAPDQVSGGVLNEKVPTRGICVSTSDGRISRLSVPQLNHTDSGGFRKVNLVVDFVTWRRPG